jgi:hypothetical protein
VVALPLQPIISFTGAMPDGEPLFEGALGQVRCIRRNRLRTGSVVTSHTDVG